jgi:aspartate/tyrosine/aromatic aminotransferase
MFDALPLAPPDPILGITDAFAKDPNPTKINLSVGVYKDARGSTPVLESVKAAERRMLDGEKTKNYLAIEGHKEYDQRVQELLFGPGHEIHTSGRAVTAQTPGGTGALRVASDFLRKHFPSAKIWCSKPTWANHPAVFAAAGLPVEQYAYINAAGQELDFAAMLAAIKQIPQGDVILLHACCHNPS